MRENEGLYLWDEDAFLGLKLTAALEVKAHLGIKVYFAGQFKCPKSPV